MKLIDTHAHLTSEQILPVLDDVVARAQKAGIEKIVNICTDEKSLAEGLLLPEVSYEAFLKGLHRFPNVTFVNQKEAFTRQLEHEVRHGH